MNLIEKENIVHWTQEINFRVYDHSRSSLEFYFEAHWHPEYELNYIHTGPLTVMLGGYNYVLHSNELLFINKNILHSCSGSNDRNVHYSSILFGEDFVFSGPKDLLYQKYIYPLFEANMRLPAIITADTPGGGEIIECVRNLLSIYQQKNFSYEIELRSELLRFFHIALRNHLFEKESSREPIMNSIVNQALLTIHQNYMQPLSIKTLSNACHITHSYFCRLFKTYVGQSPKSYLLNYRIANARFRLTHTDEPVNIIAMDCGFEDMNYFSRYFRKITGVSPTEYRKNR